MAAELLPDPDDAAGTAGAAGAPAWPVGSGTDGPLVSLWGLGCRSVVLRKFSHAPDVLRFCSVLEEFCHPGDMRSEASALDRPSVGGPWKGLAAGRTSVGTRSPVWSRLERLAGAAGESSRGSNLWECLGPNISLVTGSL